MQVSHESIYRTLYVQSRGALRKELTTCLRTGRVIRRPGAVPANFLSCLRVQAVNATPPLMPVMVS